MKVAIFIQPDDYSIHKLEYSASVSNLEKKNKEIFSIEAEYGHEPAVNSKMCLKYISFNNSFTIPDSTDNDFFKVVDSGWQRPGGPYAAGLPPNMTVVTKFNRKIDPLSGSRIGNYAMTIGKRKAKITRIKVDGDILYITVRDDKFKHSALRDSCNISYENLTDIDGKIFNKRRDIEFHQFRELFVQEYNKPLEVQNNCFIQPMPLEQNCISISNNSGRFWMNTPLKAEEKQQDSLDHKNLE
jgi:hypothetical protein